MKRFVRIPPPRGYPAAGESFRASTLDFAQGHFPRVRCACGTGSMRPACAAHLVGRRGARLTLRAARRHRKDFDIATDATPEELQNDMFRNCRLIGRRLRLASRVRQRDRRVRDVPRASSDDGSGEPPHDRRHASCATTSTAASGRRDKPATSPETRCTNKHSVSACAIMSAAKKTARPRVASDRRSGTRYREDPVSMLRAVRWPPSVISDLQPEASAPSTELGELLLHAPPRDCSTNIEDVLPGTGPEKLRALEYRLLIECFR